MAATNDMSKMTRNDNIGRRRFTTYQSLINFDDNWGIYWSIASIANARVHKTGAVYDNLAVALVNMAKDMCFK